MNTSANLVEFLSRLRKLGVQLTVKEGRLGCSAPKGTLTPELKAALAERKSEILELLQNGRPDQPKPIERLQATGLLPPSLAQQRLWFLEQMNPGNTAYTISCGLRFEGKLNRAALEQSLREMIRRHEVLRTALVVVEGSPRAVLREAGDWHLEVVSRPGVPEPDQIPELNRIAKERANRPFDLAQPPLMRACVVEFDSKTHGFILEIHHICCDGWSMGVLTEELIQLYTAFRAGEASPLEELPIQYCDYAQWHREYIENGGLLAETAYWQEKLRDPLGTLDLPGDHPRPPLATSRGARLHQKLPLDLLESVRRFGLSENVTPFVVLLAVFKIMLFRYTGQTDVIVGSVTAGRSRPELEKLAGLFLNNLALRTDL